MIPSLISHSSLSIGLYSPNSTLFRSVSFLFFDPGLHPVSGRLVSFSPLIETSLEPSSFSRVLPDVGIGEGARLWGRIFLLFFFPADCPLLWICLIVSSGMHVVFDRFLHKSLLVGARWESALLADLGWVSGLPPSGD